MIVHIKNITASHEELETRLTEIGCMFMRHKDTYSVQTTDEKAYAKIEQIEKDFKKQGKIIMVKKNGI